MHMTTPRCDGDYIGCGNDVHLTLQGVAGVGSDLSNEWRHHFGKPLDQPVSFRRRQVVHWVQEKVVLALVPFALVNITM